MKLKSKTKIRKKPSTKHKAKKVRWVRLFIVLIIIAMIVTILTQFTYYYIRYHYGVRQRQVFDMKLKISDYVGFSVDQDLINFGVVMPGGGSKRFIDISADEPTYVVIMVEGDIAPLVGVSENNFVFEGDKTIIFTAVAPVDIEEGEYTGKATVLFKNP